MGDRESAAKTLIILTLSAFGMGLLALGFTHAKGEPYSIEANCRSNNENGFYPYVPGCEDYVEEKPAEEATTL